MKFDYPNANGKKIVFDFDAYPKCVEVLTYDSDDEFEITSSIIRVISKGSVVWSYYDSDNISYEAMKYCERLAKNLAFA